jgi:hypothetical protein
MPSASCGEEAGGGVPAATLAWSDGVGAGDAGCAAGWEAPPGAWLVVSGGLGAEAAGRSPTGACVEGAVRPAELPDDCDPVVDPGAGCGEGLPGVALDISRALSGCGAGSGPGLPAAALDVVAAKANDRPTATLAQIDAWRGALKPSPFVSESPRRRPPIRLSLDGPSLGALLSRARYRFYRYRVPTHWRDD